MQSVKTMTTPLTDYQSVCGTPTALGGGILHSLSNSYSSILKSITH